MSTGTLKNYMPRVAFSFLSVTLLLVMPGQGFAQSAIGPARTSGSITVLDLPRVADYWVSATRQPGGKIVFDGHAPDEATRTDFANDPNADVQWLQLGSGSPTHYHAAVEFGLAILDQLEQGRFALRDNVVTLIGSASSQADYVAVTDALSEGLPQGLVLARAEIFPPKAEAFQWTATKSSDGAIALTGMVPDPEAEQALLRASGATQAAWSAAAVGGTGALGAGAAGSGMAARAISRFQASPASVRRDAVTASRVSSSLAVPVRDQVPCEKLRFPSGSCMSARMPVSARPMKSDGAPGVMLTASVLPPVMAPKKRNAGSAGIWPLKIISPLESFVAENA